jgi:DNA modification methylase
MHKKLIEYICIFIEYIYAMEIEIINTDGIQYLSTIPANSIDLVITDPPYIISRESGMNTLYNTVKENEEQKVEFVKTEDEWNIYRAANEIEDNEPQKSI